MRDRVEDFLHYMTVERGVSPNTLSAYRNDLNQLIEFVETSANGASPSPSWEDVSEQTISEYLFHLRDLGYSETTPRAQDCFGEVAVRLPRCGARSGIEPHRERLHAQDRALPSRPSDHRRDGAPSSRPLRHGYAGRRPRCRDAGTALRHRNAGERVDSPRPRRREHIRRLRALLRPRAARSVSCRYTLGAARALEDYIIPRPPGPRRRQGRARAVPQPSRHTALRGRASGLFSRGHTARAGLEGRVTPHTLRPQLRHPPAAPRRAPAPRPRASADPPASPPRRSIPT